MLTVPGSPVWKKPTEFCLILHYPTGLAHRALSALGTHIAVAIRWMWLPSEPSLQDEVLAVPWLMLQTSEILLLGLANEVPSSSQDQIQAFKGPLAQISVTKHSDILGSDPSAVPICQVECTENQWLLFEFKLPEQHLTLSSYLTNTEWTVRKKNETKCVIKQSGEKSQGSKRWLLILHLPLSSWRPPQISTWFTFWPLQNRIERNHPWDGVCVCVLSVLPSVIDLPAFVLQRKPVFLMWHQMLIFSRAIQAEQSPACHSWLFRTVQTQGPGYVHHLLNCSLWKGGLDSNGDWGCHTNGQMWGFLTV